MMADAKEIIDCYEIYNKKSYSVPENLTVFIGPTLGGKSTLINFLLQNLEVEFVKNDDDDDEFSFKRVDHNLGPVIGNCSSNDEPIYNLPAQDLTMAELPSMDNHAGLKEVIKNCLLTRNIVNSAKSVRVVFVFPFDMMRNNPYPLLRILSKLNDINCDVAFVVTQLEKGDVKAMLERTVNSNFKNADDTNTEVIKKAKSVIEKVVTSELFFDFFAPIPNKKWDREKLLAIIKKVKGLKISYDPINVEGLKLNNKIYSKHDTFLALMTNDNLKFKVDKKTKKQLLEFETDKGFTSESQNIEVDKKTQEDFDCISKPIQGVQDIIDEIEKNLNESHGEFFTLCTNFISAVAQQSGFTKTENTTKSKSNFDNLIINDKSRLDFGKLNMTLTADNDISKLLEKEMHTPKLSELLFPFVEKYIQNIKLQEINEDLKLIYNFKTLSEFCVYFLNFITYTVYKAEQEVAVKKWYDRLLNIWGVTRGYFLGGVEQVTTKVEECVNQLHVKEGVEASSEKQLPGSSQDQPEGSLDAAGQGAGEHLSGPDGPKSNGTVDEIDSKTPKPQV